MEEDRDLEELRKAIRSGDKERAERIAVTLLKNPKPKKNPTEIPWAAIIVGLATLGVFVLSLLDMWWTHSRKKRKEEEQYV